MSPSSEITLATAGLSKVYGKGANRFTALHDITLSVRKGESLAIVGKSGSGKSSLMHLLALLDTPTGGSVSIDGTEAGKLRGGRLDRLRNQSFGFVFQQFFLNGNQSALENVILPLKIAGVAAGERQRRGIEALEAVELGDQIHSRARDLSGGQKQRVVIARALINGPSVIFADEPTGNLDSATGNLIETMLFRLNKERGITLIVVTHDPDLAALCDRSIELKDGAITKEG